MRHTNKQEHYLLLLLSYKFNETSVVDYILSMNLARQRYYYNFSYYSLDSNQVDYIISFISDYIAELLKFELIQNENS